MDYKYFLFEGNEEIEELQFIRIDDIEFHAVANGNVFQGVVKKDTGNDSSIVILYRDSNGVYETEYSKNLVLSDRELDELAWVDKSWPIQA